MLLLMYPILVSFGPIHLYSFGTLLIIGVLFSWLLARYLIEKNSLALRNLTMAMVWGGVGGLVFARAGFVVMHLDKFFHDWLSILWVWSWFGEMEIWAGILGVGAGMMLYWIKHNEPIFLWLDIMSLVIQPLVMAVSVGLSLSAVGLTVEALGRPTSLPWGIVVDSVDLPFANVPVHPLLLYTGFTASLVFIGLLVLRNWADKYVGRLFALMLLPYALLWVALYVVRWHMPDTVLGIDVFILNAVLYVAIAIACSGYIIRKRSLAQHRKARATIDL